MTTSIKQQISQAIKQNTEDDLELTPKEFHMLNSIQDSLFDKLNNFNIIIKESSSDKILSDYIIAYRVYPNITVNQFIGIYTEINTVIHIY